MSLTCTVCPTEQVRQLERSIGLKDLAMAEMEEKIRNMEASTYDGVFIWKITEFARKRQEAITGRSPAIFSPGVQNSQNLLHLSWVWVSLQVLHFKARLRKSGQEKNIPCGRECFVCSMGEQRVERREVQAVDGMRKGSGCNCLVCFKCKGNEIPAAICVKGQEVELVIAVL